MVHDTLHVRQKAHVQHTIGLVHDHKAHGVELQPFLVDEFEQPAGRRDQHMAALL